MKSKSPDIQEDNTVLEENEYFDSISPIINNNSPNKVKKLPPVI